MADILEYTPRVRAVRAPVEWQCLCGTRVLVRVDRIVPDHNDSRGHWCAFSRCTLAPRVLAAASAR
jgi:hypothetical protein